jgi:prepilin-type N-terminal cleavage/methylation domain-containing protein
MKSRGLTLFEVVIALALVSVLAALALPAVWSRLGEARVDAAARQVEAAVLSVRARAQRDGSALALSALEERGGRVQLLVRPVERPGVDDEESAGAARLLARLPEGVSIRPGVEDSHDEDEGEAPGSTLERALEPVRVVVALPDGMLLISGPIQLSTSDARRVVMINRWTGACAVQRPAPPPGEDEPATVLRQGGRR